MDYLSLQSYILLFYLLLIESYFIQVFIFIKDYFEQIKINLFRFVITLPIVKGQTQKLVHEIAVSTDESFNKVTTNKIFKLPEHGINVEKIR